MRTGPIDWLLVSKERFDHSTFVADIPGGVLVRHIEFGNIADGSHGVVAVQLVFVPGVRAGEFTPVEDGQDD